MGTLRSNALLTPLLILLFTYPSASTADTQEALAELPLEELVKVRVVTTASKTEEPAATAPGVISVITQDDIRRMGALSVAEVLNHATSVFIFGSAPLPISPGSITSLRGDVAQSNPNPRVLYLINGRPFRDSLSGNSNSTLLFDMPLFRISRIEVLRGPGSVLYGTNAYDGVINIITLDAKNQDAIANVSYGSFNTWIGSITGGKEFGDLRISGGATVLNTKGWTYQLVDENQVRSSEPLTTLRPGGDLELDYKDFRFYNFLGSVDESAVGPIAIWTNPHSKTNTFRWLSDLRYKTRLTENWEGGIYFTYNMNRVNTYFPQDSPKSDFADNSSDDYLIETTHFLDITKELKLTLGATVDFQSGKIVRYAETSNGTTFDVFSGNNPDPLLAVPFYRHTVYTGYTQAEYSFSEAFKLVAGGQINKSPNLSLDFVPRLGAILSMNTGFGSKLLYGQAYRSSNGLEHGISIPNDIYGNPSVRPETITTLEAQVSYKRKIYDLALTYFHSNQNDVISRSFPSEGIQTVVNGALSPLGVSVIINRGKIVSQGLEFEGGVSPVDRIRFDAGVTYEWLHTESIDAAGAEVVQHDPLGMPLTQAKLALTLNPLDSWRLSLYDNYFGNFGSINPLYPESNPPVRAFHYASLNLQYQMSQHVGLNFSAKNLFSSPIYYPEVLRHIINSTPGEPGIAFFGGITGTL